MAIIIMNIRLFQNIGFLLCFSCASSSLVLFLFLTNLRNSHWGPVYLDCTHEQLRGGAMHVPPFKQEGLQTAVRKKTPQG